MNDYISRDFGGQPIGSSSSNTTTTIITNTGNYVSITGDTMSGILNMGNNKITNLGNPTLSTDAANAAYYILQMQVIKLLEQVIKIDYH